MGVCPRNVYAFSLSDHSFNMMLVFKVAKNFHKSENNYNSVSNGAIYTKLGNLQPTSLRHFVVLG